MTNVADQIFQAVCKKVKIEEEARQTLLSDVGVALMWNAGDEEMAKAAVQISRKFIFTQEELEQGKFKERKVSFPAETDFTVLNRVPDYLLTTFYVERCCERENCDILFRMTPNQRKFCARCNAKENKRVV